MREHLLTYFLLLTLNLELIPLVFGRSLFLYNLIEKLRCSFYKVLTVVSSTCVPFFQMALITQTFSAQPTNSKKLWWRFVLWDGYCNTIHLLYFYNFVSNVPLFLGPLPVSKIHCTQAIILDSCLEMLPKEQLIPS